VAGVALAYALAQGGCAGVKPNASTGTGGSTGLGGAGAIGPPPINGLESLEISPTTASVILMANAAGGLTSAPQQFTATGTVHGVSQDVTPQVTWVVDLKGVTLTTRGLATATAPGTYRITAKSGTPGVGDAQRHVLGRDLDPNSIRGTTTRPCSTRPPRGARTSSTPSTIRCFPAT
jgi:hypothetical protein